MNSTDESYWSDYDGLQQAKHQLLKNYLGGWFPILSKRKGRVIYLDSHAGRGRHNTGQEGSPILALKLLLEHKQREAILSSTEVRFIFFENNKSNYKCLCDEIKALGKIPPNVVINCIPEDYEEILRDVICDLKMRNQTLAPIFAFVDPFGFTLPMDLLNELLNFQACELLINFMYRYVDMAIHKESLGPSMDSLFGCNDWKQLIEISDSNIRAEKTILLFARQLSAQHITSLYMRGTNGALKYVLIHATNHPLGRKVMKKALWSITPDGSFTAYENHSPYQPILLSPDPDLEQLKVSLLIKFSGKQVRMEKIDSWLIGELYLETHLHTVIRELINDEIVKVSGFQGRFAFKKNPVIGFPAYKI